jgi:autotransporter-associated beta strand protein
MRGAIIKRIFKSAYVHAFLYLFIILTPAGVLAANSQWDGTTNGLWNTGTNWSGDGGKPPSDTDTALFNNDGNGNFRLDLGAGGATVKSILFQGASCPAYVIGTGRDQMLTVSDKGSIAVAGDADFQRFDSKITLPAGTYSFINNSTRNIVLRFNNDITGSAAGKTTLTLGGGSGEYPGRNPFGGVISGVISDGPNYTLEIIKDGKGTWTLEKRNYYSGGTTINEGTLRLLSGSYNLLGSGDVTIKDGGTLVIGERGPGVMKLDNDFYIQGTGQNNNGTIFNLQDSIIGGVVTLTGNTTIQSNYGALEFSEKIKGLMILQLLENSMWQQAVNWT